MNGSTVGFKLGFGTELVMDTNEPPWGAVEPVFAIGFELRPLKRSTFAGAEVGLLDNANTSKGFGFEAAGGAFTGEMTKSSNGFMGAVLVAPVAVAVVVVVVKNVVVVEVVAGTVGLETGTGRSMKSKL